MKNYIFNFDKNKAFASVMVLIMTVIIITIGFSFVFLSRGNNNLASKSSTWLLDYYRTESVVNEDIANLENYLSEHNIKLNNENVLEQISKIIKSDILRVDIDGKNIKVDIFINNIKLKDLKIDNNIGIETSLTYSIKNKTLKINYKKEIPPELEYDSFY